MSKLSMDCPVPKDQQPMNEYLSLKSSIFFLWTTTTLSDYLKSTFVLAISVYFFTLSLILASVNPVNNIGNNTIFIYMIIFGNIVLNLYFIRIYLGWQYIYSRLLKASVSYEESGWYDGQVWVKTPKILMQDKLIAEYQLIPILSRLKWTVLCLLSTSVLGSLCI
nr:photosystem I assembly protein Ycf36 [Chroomonas collegionis]